MLASAWSVSLTELPGSLTELPGSLTQLPGSLTHLTHLTHLTDSTVTDGRVTMQCIPLV